MKTILYTLIFGAVSQFTNAQIVEIPDANFKNALLAYEPAIDTNADGEIQVSEAEAVFYLSLEDKSISDATGIEAFVNLTSLNLHVNAITSIDVTNLTQLTTLAVGRNQISSLDVSQNTSLKIFSFYENLLTEIDVTNNPDLELIYPGYNPITELDFSQNPNLKRITCLSVPLTELDFSNNPLLENIALADMENLTFINLQNETNSTLAEVWITGFLPSLQCVQVDADIVDNIPDSWVLLDEINFSADCSLGTNDLSELELKIYPNPVQDVLNVSSQKKIEAVKIYDANGKLISNSNQNKISVKHLPAGIYWVQIQIEGKIHQEKFIKKN